jgi:TRAP-type transport system periplasmic protein
MFPLIKYAPVALAVLCLAAGAQAQTTLTMSLWTPPTHPLARIVLQGFADEVEQASGGRLRFQMLPQLPVAGPRTFEAVRDGLVDVSIAVTSWTPDRHVLPAIAEFPGGGATAEINSVAYNRVHWKLLQESNEYKGVHLIGVFTHGPGQVFSTRRQIKRASDLEGMKIRTGGGSSEAMVRALGASPLLTSVPQEAHELLRSGNADGTFFPQDSFVSFKLDKVVNYATFYPGGLFNYAFGFFMNEEKWNNLTSQDQALITRFGGEYLARRAGKAWDNADRLGYEAMKEAGVQIDEASGPLVAEIDAKAKPMIAAWIAEVREKRHADGAMLLRAFHEELKRVAAGE